MFRPPDPPVRTRFSPRRSRSSPCGPTYQRHRRAGRRLWPAVRAPTAAEWWCGWPRHGRAVGQGPWTISEWTSPWSPASGRCCAGGWTGIRQRRSVGRPPLRPRVMHRLERTIRPATDVVSEGEPERPAALAGCGAGQLHMPGDAGVGDGCREVAQVDEGVMSSAQEGGVREVGRSAPAPPLHVMDVAPLGRDGAAGEGAVPIAVPDGCALGRREETVTSPMSSTSPLLPSTIGMTRASQAIRRTTAGERRSPFIVSPAPRHCSMRCARGMVTTTWAFSVFGCSPGEDTPRRTTSSSASARRAAADLGSGSPSSPFTGADRA